jgi:hypothetical protein
MWRVRFEAELRPSGHWNYPLHQALGKLGGAIRGWVPGDSEAVEATPVPAYKLADAMRCVTRGIPDGVIPPRLGVTSQIRAERPRGH